MEIRSEYQVEEALIQVAKYVRKKSETICQSLRKKDKNSSYREM